MTTLATCVAMLALAAALSPALASAHEFEASKTGAVGGNATTAQVFKFPVGEITCTAATDSGTITAKKSTSLTLVVNYSDCTAFGIVAAEVSTAELLLGADGTLEILKGLTVTTVGCVIAIPAQTLEGSVIYENGGSDIVVKIDATKIGNSGTGASCTHAEEQSGSYIGSFLVGLAGSVGTLQWV